MSRDDPGTSVNGKLVRQHAAEDERRMMTEHDALVALTGGCPDCHKRIDAEHIGPLDDRALRVTLRRLVHAWDDGLPVDEYIEAIRPTAFPASPTRVVGGGLTREQYLRAGGCSHCWPHDETAAEAGS